MKMLEKLQKRLQEGKKNNKGFSLVELIIVIAIMAILVGIVGTQVIPYIENSRKARDIQVFSGLVTDAMSAYSSQAANLDPSVVYTIEVNVSTNAVTVTSTPAGADGITALTNAFTQLNNLGTGGTGEVSLVSRAASTITTLEIVCQNGDPMVSLDPDGVDDDDANNEFDAITAS